MEKERNYKAFIIPIVAVAVFTLLIFGAGFAYFAATVTATNVANISTQLPDSGTTFVVESDPCEINVSAANMTIAQNGVYVGNDTCHLNITMTGAVGVTCTYDVMLLSKGTTYTPSSDIPSGQFEFSGLLTNTGTGSAIDLGSTETQMNTLAGQKVAHGTMTLTATTLAHSYTFEEKWYNLNIDQSKYGAQNTSRANEKYEYELKVANVVC